jgi:hypothetical protein
MVVARPNQEKQPEGDEHQPGPKVLRTLDLHDTFQMVQKIHCCVS